MKRIISTLFIIVLLLAAFGFYYYAVLLPRKLSEAVIHEDKEIPRTLPEKYRKKVEAIRQEVKHTSTERVITYFESKEVTFEDVLTFIDQIDANDIEKAASKIDTSVFESPGQVFDTLIAHFDFKDIPVENFREDFIGNVDKHKIGIAMQYYHDNKEQLPLLLPMAKQTLKKVLIKKKEEIEAGLNGGVSSDQD